MKTKLFLSLMMLALPFFGMAQNSIGGIFPEINSISYANFQNEKEIENGNLLFTSLDDNSIKVNVDFFSVDAINPYSFNYEYKVDLKEKETLVDLKAIVNPMEFYLNENTNQEYIGEQLVFPSQLFIGQELDNCEGRLVYTKDAWTMESQFESTHRWIKDKKLVSFNGVEMEVCLIASKLEVTKKVNGHETMTTTELLTEWFLPETGIIKVERQIQGEDLLHKHKTAQIQKIELK